MRLRALSILVLVFVLPLLAVSAYADTAVLGNAQGFAVLGATGSSGGVTNTNTTTINGLVGSSPNNAMTGTGGCPAAGCINFTGGGIASPAQSALAQTSLTTAIVALDGLSGSAFALSPPATNFVAGNLTFSPGVYSTGAIFTLSNNDTITLNAGGQNNVDFIFLVGSQLVTGTGSSVVIINPGSDPSSDGVYWVEGSQATLNGSTFAGNVLAGTSITMGSAVTITCGSALASTGLVSMIGDTISTGCNGGFISSTTGQFVTTSGNTTGPGPGGTPVPTPEPGTFALLSAGLALGLLTLRKLR